MTPIPPPLPTDPIRPTVQMVGDLVRTRLVLEGGDFADTFNDDTVPTEAQVERLIDQATNAIYTQIPGSIAEDWAPAGMHLSALYAAILVEASYFREQLTDDQVELYRNLLTAGIAGLSASIGTQDEKASRTIDSVVLRSVMTDHPLYLMYLDMRDMLPPPWVMEALDPDAVP